MMIGLAASLIALALLLLYAAVCEYLRLRRARRSWRRHHHEQRRTAFAFRRVFARLYQRRLTHQRAEG